MTISDFVMVIAVLLSPVIAVRVEKAIEAWREARQRKLRIFKTLMATRGTRVAARHIEALNTIELEFDVKKPEEKKVVDAWKVYLDHLNNWPVNSRDPGYQSNLDAWNNKANDYLADLLFTMSKALGYDFNLVELKRGAYIPQGPAQDAWERSLVRRGLLDIIVYRRASLPVDVAQRAEGERGKETPGGNVTPPGGSRSA